MCCSQQIKRKPCQSLQNGVASCQTEPPRKHYIAENLHFLISSEELIHKELCHLAVSSLQLFLLVPGVPRQPLSIACTRRCVHWHEEAPYRAPAPTQDCTGPDNRRAQAGSVSDNTRLVAGKPHPSKSRNCNQLLLNIRGLRSPLQITFGLRS